MRPPALKGMRPGWPLVAVDPAMAMSVNSLAGRWLHGPPRPKLDTDTMVASGRRSASASQPRPKASISPGSERSITRSAVEYRWSSRSRPTAVRYSSITPCLVVLRKRNSGPKSSTGEKEAE